MEGRRWRGGEEVEGRGWWGRGRRWGVGKDVGCWERVESSMQDTFS
jgi:hypothetical protein